MPSASARWPRRPEEFHRPSSVTVPGACALPEVASPPTATTTMARSTVLMMVLPSVLAFGVVCLLLGAKYGEYRATH